jgi:chemotaxis signal transduction protein
MAELGGYVTFEVGDTVFAIDVAEVAAVLRTSDVELLPTSERMLAGRPLSLVDAQGHSVPVLDLRSSPDLAGDVLLPRESGHAGVVVDRVTAVLRPGELAAETLVTPALPSYAIGVLPPAEGGRPVLLVTLPAVPDCDDPAFTPNGEPALGDPLLVPTP